MTSTEKEFAEKMRQELRQVGVELDKTGTDVLTAVRNLAELLGVELAPEKPAPGTWHKTADGFPAYVDEGGVLHASAGRLDDWIIYGLDDRWPDLTPARVVPAELADAVERFVDEMDKLGVNNEDREGLLEQAARLAAHGITSDEVTRAVRVRYAPAAPVELTEDEVRHEWDDSTAPHYWEDMDSQRREGVMHVIRTIIAKYAHAEPVEASMGEQRRIGKSIWQAYIDDPGTESDGHIAMFEKARAALRAHAHAAPVELPGRDEVRKTLDGVLAKWGLPWQVTDNATDDVVALLGGEQK